MRNLVQGSEKKTEKYSEKQMICYIFIKAYSMKERKIWICLFHLQTHVVSLLIWLFFFGSNSMSNVIWFFLMFFFCKYCLSEENVYVNNIIPFVVLNSGSGAIVRFIFIMSITAIVINATILSTCDIVMKKKLNEIF